MIFALCFSAGVGRTGAFIAIDYSLDQAKAEDEVDVMNFTALMRSYRVNMIQNAVCCLRQWNYGSFHYWESELTFGNLTNFWKLTNQNIR